MLPSPSAVPIETRSQPSGPTSRISTPRSSRPCQTACRSAKRPEQHEVGVAVGDLEPLLAQPGDRRVALGAQVVDPAEQLVGVPQRGQRGRLGDGGEVVGQPHHPDRVADLRRRPRGSRAGRRRARTPCSSCGSRPGCGATAAARARSACPARRNSAYASSTTTSPSPAGLAERRRRPRAAARCRSGCSATAAARRSAARSQRPARGRASRSSAKSLRAVARRPSAVHRCRGRTRDTSSTSARSSAPSGPGRRRPAAAAASPRWSRWPPTPGPA